MTLRHLYAFLALVFCTLSSHAQPVYYNVTSGDNVPQILGGFLVTPQRTGFGFCQGKYLNAPGYCGVSPYYIGDCGRSGWRFRFSHGGVTDVRIHMASLHDDDTIRISIPNFPNPPRVIAITTGDLSTWASACSPSTTNAIPTNLGYITATGAPSGFSDVQIDIQNPFSPYLISDIMIEHMRSPGNTTADGVVFDLAFAYDTCNLRFNATVEEPQCSGKPLKFHASAFPNTTYSWSTNVSAWTSTAQDPVIPNANILMNGVYKCVATRGTCVYEDEVPVFVDLTPAITGVGQAGPKCPGENDTLSVSSFQATYEWHGPNGFVDAGAKPVLKNVQKMDEGDYCVFAKSITNGCISDTVCVNFKVNDPAIAKFEFEEALGCEADTIRFKNLSIPTTNSAWSFGDGNTSAAVNPTHAYISPTMPVTYTVRLRVGNGKCSDETTADITFNHPLQAAFTFDDDSICQHTPVSLNNTSVFAPATTPKFEWLMRDGASYTSLNVNHTFDVSGEYDVMLRVTDFLGCKDSTSHVFVVDSTGSIDYTESENSLCLGSSISFEGYFSPWGINNTKWDFGDGAVLFNTAKVNHAYSEAGTYTVTYEADYRICPDAVFTREITVKPHPLIDLGPDRTICPNGSPVTLTDEINRHNPDASWKWNTEVINNSATFLVYHPGTYAATVELDGCSSTDSVLIEKNCYIDIPNAFTPNGDGSNDYFLPKELLSRGLTQFDMSIFNRWGQVIFQTNSISGKGWDGRFNNEPQASGVYVYTIRAEFQNGESEKYQGNVTLLR